MVPMKRYSPSSTETWLTCPLKRHLSRGYQPRRLGKRELGAILGTAFAAGVNAWKTGESLGLAPDAPHCADIAVGSVARQLAEYDAAGCAVGDFDRAQQEALPRRAERAVLNVITNDPFPPTWKVLDVECSIPTWGDCRIDLGMNTPLGVVVVDWKTKLSLDPKWLPREVDRWRFSEQRFHYSNAYAEVTGQPVYAFYIGLVVCEPFRVHVIPFVNHPEELKVWQQAREQTWRDMEQEELGERRIGMAAKHHDEFGPCEFQRACFEHLLDPHLMAHEYAPRKARP